MHFEVLYPVQFSEKHTPLFLAKKSAKNILIINVLQYKSATQLKFNILTGSRVHNLKNLKKLQFFKYGH